MRPGSAIPIYPWFGVGDKMQIDFLAYFIEQEFWGNTWRVTVETQEAVQHRLIGLLIEGTIPIHNAIISVRENRHDLLVPLLDKVPIVPMNGNKA
jgi:hypothetical protein